nr:reverse transcriptase domain-containing protein [Tanacetum cinerariifolium]
MRWKLSKNQLDSFLLEPIEEYRSSNNEIGNINLWDEGDEIVNDEEELWRSLCGLAMPAFLSDLDYMRSNTVKNQTLFATIATIEEKQIPKLKEFPSHLEYAFLDVLAKHKATLAWKVAGIKGIIPSVREGILLRHKISGAGIEVDKAKVNVITKLPYPINGLRHWGIDSMGPFPSSRNNKYILVAEDYVSKWVEAKTLPTNDAQVVVKFLQRLFSRFGILKALISDREMHFCNSMLEKTLKKYKVTHRLATLYHPQISGQTENTNRAIKRILERMVNGNRKEWADKLDDALWAFRIVYGNACHLIIELEHKAYCALKVKKDVSGNCD